MISPLPTSIYLCEKQLVWLEEKPDHFVEIVRQPFGEPFVESLPTETIRVRDIPNYIQVHGNENLWRSWKIFTDQCRKEKLGPVPSIFDIDDERDKQQNPDLDKAFRLTKALIDSLCRILQINNKNIRFIFSGHKGFHIEVKPRAPVELLALRKRLIQDCSQKEELFPISGNEFLGTTTLDSFHNEIRLTGSINSWRSSSREIIQGKVFQFNLDEIFRLNFDEIVAKAIIIR